MNKMLIIPKQIVCADERGTILKDYAVEIFEDKIFSVKSLKEFDLKIYKGEIYQRKNLTLIPGFIQTHIHLCQTLFRGLADDLHLLDWLQQKIFPFENAHDKSSLKISVRLGINELIKGGTTTILDMGTLNHQESIFEELTASGMRVFAGKCMMDENDLYPKFKADTGRELKYTHELASQFHNSAEGRIKYGFAPRFVLSCSEKLLKETKEMMKDFEGSIFHTHSSENENEVAEVKKRFGKENIEYFDSINILDDHSVLAHCIHINDNEIDILKKRNSRVAHCPSSNLKLGSGIADIPKLLSRKISVSLGADGAPCNNNLSAFTEMRLAALIQKPIHGAASMDAKTVFYLATIEGAKALHIDNETGSIEAGKKADLVLIDLDNPYNSLSENDEDTYSSIVYSSSKNDIKDVMINGKWVLNNGESSVYSDDGLFLEGKAELKKLLSRI
jgi:5-methylthioadenosine/S-adenosylhomocysteine deaminase